MAIKYSYNPYTYKGQFYEEYEERRRKAGGTKPASQIKDAEELEVCKEMDKRMEEDIDIKIKKGGGK